MRAKTASHLVALMVADGVSLFELSIALEIFGPQDPEAGRSGWYELAVCGVGGRGASVRTDRGLRIDLTHSPRHALTAYTLLVPPHNPDGAVPLELIEAIRRAH